MRQVRAGQSEGQSFLLSCIACTQYPPLRSVEHDTWATVAAKLAKLEGIFTACEVSDLFSRANKLMYDAETAFGTEDFESFRSSQRKLHNILTDIKTSAEEEKLYVMSLFS